MQAMQVGGMHFSNTLCLSGQRLSGMSSCGLGYCGVIPMALIDVFGDDDICSS